MPRALRRFLLLGLLLPAAGVRGQFINLSGIDPVVFFPPNPPIYGAPVENAPPGRPRLHNERPMTPPGGVGDLVAEYFYPPLSTWLHVPKLPAQLGRKLEDYRAKRRTQIHALLDKFVALHDATAEVRERELRAFAAEQTPQLATLELLAEELREQLIGANSGRIDWNSDRRWNLRTLGARQDWRAREAEYQIVRAAVYYQKGLLPQQRGLLREVALELQPFSRRAQGHPVSRNDADVVFFSPELARMRLPTKLSPVLRDKLGKFNGEKAALKRELHEAVLEHDGADEARRLAVFRALADAQYPRLTLLEQLADEIRSELGLPVEAAPPPAPPWLPAGLLETIKTYNEDRDSYYGEMKYRIEQALYRMPRPDLNVSSDERVRRLAEHRAQQETVRRATIQAFQEYHSARFAELEQRYKLIRNMLTVVAEKQKDPETGRPLDADALLRRHVASTEQFETFGREATIYVNYRIAMLQPGLSPEQRRLLFNYALVGLALPLPNGELMPQRKATQPIPSW